MKIKKILLVSLSILLCLQIVVLGIGMIGGEEAVAKLPVYILQVRSDSMYPKLKDGDCIFCADLPFGSLKKGDIINYSFTGDIITHQVIAVNNNGTVTTKGVANGYDDGEISEEYYMGKVLCKIPFLSVFLQMTESPLQKIIYIMLVVVACFGTPAIMAAERHRKQKK